MDLIASKLGEKQWLTSITFVIKRAENPIKKGPCGPFSIINRKIFYLFR